MEYFNDPVRVALQLKQALEMGHEPIYDAAQHQLDLKAWEQFFMDYSVRSLIELGTGSGSFSLFLRRQVPNFLTYDYVEPYHDIEQFEKVDILLNHGYISEKMALAERPLLLYCDNGDKAKEVKMYSPFLEVGDYLATHDFQIEIYPDDIPDGFELLINIGLTAFFRKVSDD